MDVDLPLERLREFRGSTPEPEDFDAFWARSLEEARQLPIDVRLTPIETEFTVLEITDVTFAGFGGHPVRAWYKRPAGVERDLPVVVEYIGYGSGRGDQLHNTFWAQAGFAQLVMDNRGQGASGTLRGDTPDPVGHGPAFPGSMTRGLRDPEQYFYRRLFIDAARAVDAARALPGVDPTRVAVAGGSQGGALALAAAGLSEGLAGVAAYVPFLSGIDRAIRITDAMPYGELARYFAVQRDAVAEAMRTLSYIDTVNHAKRATAPVLYTTALADPVCPPSTVFSSYNAYAGPKRIEVWPFNGHEGGGANDQRLAARFFAPLLRGEPVTIDPAADPVTEHIAPLPPLRRPV